jgi:cytochrome b561
MRVDMTHSSHYRFQSNLHEGYLRRFMSNYVETAGDFCKIENQHFNAGITICVLILTRTCFHFNSTYQTRF